MSGCLLDCIEPLITIVVPAVATNVKTSQSIAPRSADAMPPSTSSPIRSSLAVPRVLLGSASVRYRLMGENVPATYSGQLTYNAPRFGPLEESMPTAGNAGPPQNV